MKRKEKKGYRKSCPLITKITELVLRSPLPSSPPPEQNRDRQLIPRRRENDPRRKYPLPLSNYNTLETHHRTEQRAASNRGTESNDRLQER